MQESGYFDKYSPISGVWDEMYGADANVRDHYRKVIEYISEQERRAGKKAVHEPGHYVYGV
jgi:hypothetical protein